MTEDAMTLARAVRFLIAGRDAEAQSELSNLSLTDPVPQPMVMASPKNEGSSISRRPSVSKVQLAVVLKRDGWRCHYCGRMMVAGGVLELVSVLCPEQFPFPSGHHMPLDRTHPAANRVYPNVDHVHAGSQGGSWTDLDNLIAACTPCNERKGDKAGWSRMAQQPSGWCGLIDCYRTLAERGGPIRRYHLDWFKALGI